MYQKFKYILVGTIILIVVIVIITMDAGSRYNSKNNQNNQQQTKTLSAEQIQALQQANEALLNAQKKTAPSPEEQAALDNAKLMQPKQISSETEEELMRRQFEEKKAQLPANRSTTVRQQQTEDLPEIESLSTASNADVTTPAKGYITDTEGNRLPNYILQCTFKAGDDLYAIITEDNQYSSGTKYTPRKFYIYKNVDDKYYRSNYLFEHSEILAADGKSPNLTVKFEGSNVVIEYNAGAKILRKLNTTFLKNNYKQYLSSPQLKYVNEEEQENN